MAYFYDQQDKRFLYAGLGTSNGVDVYFYYPWAKYKLAQFLEYCDSDFKIPVGTVVAVRALVAALGVLMLMWFFVDLILTVKTRRNLKKFDKNSINISQAESIHNSYLADLIWMNHRVSPLPATSRSSTPIDGNTPRAGMVSRVVTPNGSNDTLSYKMAVCNNPYKAYQSRNWREKLSRFNETFFGKQDQWRSRIVYLSVPLTFIVVGYLVCLFFLMICSKDLVNTHSVADSIFRGYSTILRARATWLILPFLLLDELFEFLLFVIEAIMVRWGTETVYAQHAIARNFTTSTTPEVEEVSDFGTNSDDDDHEKVLSDELIPDGVIAVICIDTVRMFDDEKLIRNVNSVIDVIGIEKIFILQFGHSLKPADDTVIFLQERIAFGFQYVYVPERDQRAALYWFSKYYIPLFQLHQDPMEAFAITHLMVIDQSVALPRTLAIPEHFIIPQAEQIDTDDMDDEEYGENREVKKSKILPGAICFASRHLGGSFDNLDMQFEILHAAFLSERCSLSDTEMFERSNVVVFDRECLEYCAFNHEPITAAQGGDFPGIGLEMLRDAGTDGQRTIKFVHNNLINQEERLSSITSFRGFCDKLFLVFAKRKRLIGSDLAAFFSPAAVLNRTRLSEKPFVLLNILHTIFDLIRWPVVADSALRDPFGLGCILGLLMALTWIRVIVLWIVIERSPVAARIDRPSLLSAIFYPLFYAVWNLLILRPLSVLAGIFWTITDKPDTAIAIREDYEQNIPPCLPYPDAAWFSVWVAQTEAKETL